MKRAFSLLGIIAIVAVIGFSVTACDTDNNNDTPQTQEPQPSMRYQAVPHYKAGANASMARSARSVNDLTEMYVLLDSAYDDDYYYYLYYLGHINFVPLAFKDAMYYGGQGSISVAYTKTTETTEGISNAVTKAFEESSSASASASIYSKTDVKVGFLGNKVSNTTEIAASFSATIGTSVSTADTVETSTSYMSGESFTVSASVGQGDPSGMYRLSLWGTTDVYYSLKVDKNTMEIVDEEAQLSARPVCYWGIDYDPVVGSDFGRTAPGDPIEIPAFDPSRLPIPTTELDVEDGPEPLKTFHAQTFTEDKTIWDNDCFETIQTGFNIAFLKVAGYTSLTFTVNTQAQCFSYDQGPLRCRLYGEQTSNVLGDFPWVQFPDNRWNRYEQSVVVDINRIVSNSGDFLLEWDAYHLTRGMVRVRGGRTITVTANK